MNKICLVRPPRVIPKGLVSMGAAIPPVGLAYLVASLEKGSFEVIPIDAIGEDIEHFYELSDVPDVVIQGMFLHDIVSRIPKDVFMIGISCMFSCEWFLYEALAKRIRAAFPDIPIILGGEHATAEASNILRVCDAVTVCASGEGEETILELAKAFAIGSGISRIPGISYKSDGRIVKNPQRERICDINSIPSPSWKGIPVVRYHDLGYGMASTHRRAMPVVASRGCPFRCTFCSSAQMWGTELYLRDPKAVVEEIKRYKKTYDIEHIDFVDIVGVLNRNWVKELLTLLIKENLKISWLHGAGTRSEILDDEILELFKASNVLRIFYAPESGSKETLKRIDKRVNLEKITKSMKQANRLGISMRAPLIYGFPGQTLREAFENLFFSFKLSFIGVDDVVAHAFSAYPGTQLYHELIASGKIEIKKLIESHDYNSFLKNEFTTKVKNCHSWSTHIPSWTLPFFQYGGMLVSYLILFTFHPSKMVRSFNRIFIKRKPLTLFDNIVFNLVWNRKNNLSTRPKNLLETG